MNIFLQLNEFQDRITKIFKIQKSIVLNSPVKNTRLNRIYICLWLKFSLKWPKDLILYLSRLENFSPHFLIFVFLSQSVKRFLLIAMTYTYIIYVIFCAKYLKNWLSLCYQKPQMLLKPNCISCHLNVGQFTFLGELLSSGKLLTLETSQNVFIPHHQLCYHRFLTYMIDFFSVYMQ